MPTGGRALSNWLGAQLWGSRNRIAPMAATTESAFTAEGPMDTRADGVPPPAPPTAAVPAVATTAAAPASAPATTSGAAAARTAPAVESKVERRRTAPPIAARKSPRGQKEYTVYLLCVCFLCA